jgi:hypothetical protein
MKTHELKSWPDSFNAMKSGVQLFDVRFDEGKERDFKVGDIAIMREFKPCKKCNGAGHTHDGYESCGCCPEPHGKYTGRKMKFKITSLIDDSTAAGFNHMMDEETVILGLKRISSL